MSASKTAPQRRLAPGMPRRPRSAGPNPDLYAHGLGHTCAREEGPSSGGRRVVNPRESPCADDRLARSLGWGPDTLRVCFGSCGSRLRLSCGSRSQSQDADPLPRTSLGRGHGCEEPVTRVQGRGPGPAW